MISLTLKNLTKKFGGFTAVDHVNLEVPAGKLVALLGPSGCGKTTTLKMIAGLLEPTSGDILFDNESVVQVPAEKRKIGMVFQRYILFPHMNVFENIAFGLRMQKKTKAEIQQRVEEVVKLVQLEGFEKRLPGQLSGGQMQRVAIARAVVIRPNFMLMDEPLANLDAKLRLEMREFIRNLQRQLEITTIFVTHDQSEAAVLADMVAVMFDGKFHQFSTPLSLFNQPESSKVAEFIGCINVFVGKVEKKSKDGYLLSCPMGNLILRQEQKLDYQVGQKVFFTIRPDHISLNHIENAEKIENSIILKYKDMIYEGDMVKYFLEDAKGNIIQAHTPSTKFLTDAKQLVAYFDPDRIWIIPENDLGENPTAPCNT
jgi:putative spermidine/putrescine transport system ATP-binding protein